MTLEYDQSKSDANLRKRGLPFDMVADLEWTLAQIGPDTRENYGEPRFVAMVPLTQRVYVVCFTIRDSVMRVISFRKANSRETKAWQKNSRP
jgi:uncharacterized DUF497 family protein